MLSPFLASAQSTPTASIFDSFVPPKNTLPGKMVYLSLNSRTADLKDSSISWSVGGKIIQQGTGETTFNFKNGNSGQTTTITISITTPDGKQESKDISITPIGFTLLWQANTYVPPFYRGKAMMGPAAPVRAIVIPDSSDIPPDVSVDTLIYQWDRDYSDKPDLIGSGENSFSFLAPNPGNDTNIALQITSTDESVSRQVNITLSLAQPFVLFYEDNPLLGVWYNRSFRDSITLNKQEFSMKAEPYFFSNEISGVSNLNYAWTINNNVIKNSTNDITLRNDSGKTGDSQIDLSVSGVDKTLQNATQELLVHFIGSNSSVNTYF